jgi:hypothetical protein
MTKDLAEFLKGYVDAAATGQVWLFPADSATGHAISIEIPFRRVVAAAGLDVKLIFYTVKKIISVYHMVARARERRGTTDWVAGNGLCYLRAASLI